MRFSLATLLLVLLAGCLISYFVTLLFRDNIGADIKYLESQGFRLHTFNDLNGRAYLTTIRGYDRVIQDYDATIIGNQVRIGLLQLDRCQIDARQLREMLLKPELSQLDLRGSVLNSSMIENIAEKESLLGLAISGKNLSETNFRTICTMSNLGILQLSDITSDQRTILQQLAILYPRVKIYCNADLYALPDMP